ncbi:MAG: hypothetical protein IJ493_01515 [Clostridia bacterium]|nr:hypothetical protein [Clostridia bacterium]
MKKAITLILLAVLAAQTLSACGSTQSGGDTTASGDTTTSNGTSASGEYSYPYPAEGYGGEEFNILNMHDMYGMMSVIEREEITGETLDDAIYNRNRLIESKFDITLKETIIEDDWEFKTLAGVAQTTILAGDDTYDLMYIPMAGSAALISEGYFFNLYDIDTVQLDQPWWYQSFNDAITINGALYSAAGGSNLLIHDGIRLIAFNYDMMENLKLDLPYDLVREGKWTLDAFNQYNTAAANLNGDDSVAWNKDGKATYGYTHHKTNSESFIIGAGELIFEQQDGNLVYNGASERFYNLIEKLSSIISLTDARVYKGETADSEDGSYITVFRSGRTLMAMSEVNKFRGFRDLEFEFGIVPYPKYDESQDRYYSNSWYGATGAMIPVTSSDPEKVGLILDALTYEGEKSVVPVFREISVEQKGLRNEESIEMLEIITDSLVPLYYQIFSIGKDLMTEVNAAIWEKTGTVASAVAANEDAIRSDLEKLTENWGK